MSKNIVHTIVFVKGGENVFSGSLFEERELCDEFGPLDREQLKTGQMSQFRYAEGKYEFLVLPDRINIRSNKDQEILPSVLIDATQKVVRELETMKKVIPVAAVGINCEATFSAQEIGTEGKDLCNAMIAGPIATHLLEGQSLHMALTSFICPSGRVQYSIRVEPEHATQGRDLFVSINGHQDVQAGASLLEKLEAVEEVRGQVERFHQQVLSLKEK